jgi:hypothetical protein
MNRANASSFVRQPSKNSGIGVSVPSLTTRMIRFISRSMNVILPLYYVNHSENLVDHLGHYGVSEGFDGFD